MIILSKIENKATAFENLKLICQIPNKENRFQQFPYSINSNTHKNQHNNLYYSLTRKYPIPNKIN